MKKHFTFILISTSFGMLFSLPLEKTFAAKNALLLWYKQPADKWEQALPIGNGRLGAMVFGKIANEEIVLNEDTIWTGGPYEPSNYKGATALAEIRRLVFEGKYKQAHKLFGRTMMGWPVEQMKYQYLGRLWLRFPGHEQAVDYRRELDLNTAIARVTWRVDDVRFTREVFATAVDQVIVIHVTADKPGKVSFTVNITGLKNTTHSNYADDYYRVDGVPPDELFLRGKVATYLGIEGKVEYQARVKARAQGGKIEISDDDLIVTGANSATLLIPAATNFVSYNDVSGGPTQAINNVLKDIAGKSYKQIRADHIDEHQRLFGRVKLDLGATDAADKPLDERIKDFEKTDDPHLATLIFQFGRYLMVCSSRPGTQPANLQGIWNSQVNPSWDSKYTTNINLEMNYWPTEVCNLSECFEPLFDLIRDVSKKGEVTARQSYGANGWVLHQNTDIWRVTAPMDGPLWGTWALGGAWLCTHLWEHYLFHEDKEFLEKAYPIMKGAARFFLDTLVKHPRHGFLVTCPSSSPENTPAREGIEPFWDETCDMKLVPNICTAPTIDMQILRYLFDSCARASEILSVDKDFRSKVLRAKERLAPNRIGQYGQLQEWLEDWDRPNDHHRHFSHLWGMYPGHEISVQKTPLLARAVAQSLEMRGEGGTGFGLTWQICLWARMQNSNKAYRLLQNEVRVNTCDNLFSRCFSTPQVDGSFGVTAGIAEMLLQSHLGEIHLLPALPAAWPRGSVRGLRARGGFEVDMTWKDGKLSSTTIRSKKGNPCMIRYNDTIVRLETMVGESLFLNGKMKQVTSTGRYRT